jgi:hypothetical protein
MKIIILCILIFRIFANEPQKECGKYKIGGMLRQDKENFGFTLLINENTQSEFQLKISKKDYLKILPYIDTQVLIIGDIEKTNRTFHGELNSIESIERTIPDPLNTNKELGFFKINSKKCI